MIVFKFNGSKLDYAMLNNEILFNLNYIGNILGIVNPRSSINTSDPDYVKKIDSSVVGWTYDRDLNNRGELFLTEAGLYKLVMRSDKPIAEPFQKWVTKEVLPTIRKTGSYSLTQKPNHEMKIGTSMATMMCLDVPDEASNIICDECKKIALEVREINKDLAKAKEEVKVLTDEIDTKDQALDQLSDSEDLFTTTEVSACAGWKSAQQLNTVLRGKHLISSKNLPLSFLKKNGYATIRCFPYTDKKGIKRNKPQMKWTDKGRAWICVQTIKWLKEMIANTSLLETP